MLDIQKISKLGIGGWGLGGLATVDPANNDAEQIEALRYSIDKGLNFIEVNFWNSEGKSVELIKKAIDLSTKKREDLFLSLVIYDYNNPTLADVDKEVEQYFTLFETNYIDTLEFAFSAMHTYGFDNVVGLVRKYVSSGQARYTSITNASLEYLQKYHDIFKDKLFSHEVHYSFEVRDNEYLGIIDYANQHDIKNAIYQPLRRNRTAARNWPLLVELADKYQKTQNQVILSWMVAKGFLPLVKSQNKAHIDENLGALDFVLSQEDIAKLDSFKVPGYKQQDIDWTKTGNGNTIFSLPNTFDEMYPQAKQPTVRRMADFSNYLQEALDQGCDIRICVRIIDQDNNVLLIRRTTKDLYGDVWELPGGGVESGEDLQTAAAREVAEETGLQIDPKTLEYLTFFDFENVETKKRARKFAFSAILSGEPTTSQEHSVYKWTSLGEVKNMRLASQETPYDMWDDHYKVIMWRSS